MSASSRPRSAGSLRFPASGRPLERAATRAGTADRRSRAGLAAIALIRTRPQPLEGQDHIAGCATCRYEVTGPAHAGERWAIRKFTWGSPTHTAKTFAFGKGWALVRFYENMIEPRCSRSSASPDRGRPPRTGRSRLTWSEARSTAMRTSNYRGSSGENRVTAGARGPSSKVKSCTALTEGLRRGGESPSRPRRRAAGGGAARIRGRRTDDTATVAAGEGRADAGRTDRARLQSEGVIDTVNRAATK